MEGLIEPQNVGWSFGGDPASDFSVLFQAAPVGLAVLDSDLRFLHVNDHLADINGVPVAAHIGHTLRELLPDLAPEVEPRFRAVLESGSAQLGLKVTGITPKAPGQRRAFIENVTPLADGGGHVRHLLIGIHEITALDEAESALRESERTLRASQQLSPEGFAIIRAVRDGAGAVVDFIWEYANPAAEAIVRGGPLAERSMAAVFPASLGHPQMFPRYVDTLTRAEPSEVEYPHEFRGKVHWFQDAAVAIDPDRVAVVFRDITERRRLTDQLELVTREFRHRVKNSIAVVASLVRSEARFAPDVPSFAKALLQRLEALSSAQDLLGADAGATVALGDIAAAALGAFAEHRLTIRSGPEAPVRSGVVTLLTLALHELATNAVKHGALSRPEGSAELTWTLDENRVRLVWRETGGPRVSPPKQEGFGSRLLTEAARRLPNGALDRDFAPGGLTATIAFDQATDAEEVPSDASSPALGERARPA